MGNSETLSQGCSEIYDWVTEQLGRKEVGTANRASAAPQCVRKRFLQNQGVQGETMQPRSLVVFATGDVVEHVLKYFISKACVGPGKLYSEVDFGEKTGTFTIQHREFDIFKQETLEYQIAGVPVTAHADGWGKRNSDGQWECIEIKSSASYGYDKFIAGETPDYIRQVHALMFSPKAKERQVRSARFFYMKKDTSHIFDRLYEYDPKVADQVMREFQVAAAEFEPAPPFQPEDETVYNRKTKTYDPTGRQILGYPCSYCEYKSNCFSEAQLDFKGGKPIWIVRAQEKKKTGWGQMLTVLEERKANG